MTIELRKATRQHEPCYVWTDPNGREWKFYQSFDRRWCYIREDHSISSIGHATLAGAREALEKMFA